MRKILSITGFLLVYALPAFALAAQVQVTLGVNSISPSTVAINVGDTVVWTNTSGTTQSVMANNSSFQSGAIAPNGQFAATFNQTGTYNYYDNSGGSAIIGEVIVGGAPVAVPATTYVNPNASYVNPNANYVPTGSSANIASLTAEVQALIAQINALKGSGGSGTSSYSAGGSCPQIGRVLSFGSSGNDVSSLQQFLGVSPQTGYFGSITRAAVEKYQTTNNIISYGTPATTGYGVVGPRTAAAIRLSCSGTSASSGSGNASGSGVVGGFLQVSPISGTAPLVTTVTATVNTAASCTGATYNLDFGDGTQEEVIPVAAGNCSQQNQSFQHTYQYGGTYTVTLSAGGHSSTASVTVSGPAAPSTSVTSPGNPAQASGSMSAFVTSGPAPLATTFYVSCASGLAYDVVFGDGSDLGSSGVSQSSCNGGLQSVAHTYAKIGSYTAQLLVFVRNSQGTISSQAVANQGITVTGASGSSSSSGSATYFQPPALTSDVGSNPLAVSLQFTAGTCSGAYSVAWGDAGISPSPTVDNPSGCNASATRTYSLSHTYSATGSYNVTLTRALPSGSSQTDTVGVSITQ